MNPTKLLCKYNISVFCAILVALSPSWNLYADDVFLKVETIPGESTDVVHRDEIVVHSYSLGVATPVSLSTGGGGMQAGKPSFQDLSISKSLDKATPKLYQAAASGQHLKLLVLVVRQPGEKGLEYLKITLTDVLVTSVSNGGSSYERAGETVTFTFAKIQMDYKQQNPDGSLGGTVSFGWDVANNTKL